MDLHGGDKTKMRGSKFRNFDQFRNEMLQGRSGPLTSPVEDIADEIYQVESQEEKPDTLWDSYDTDDD